MNDEFIVIELTVVMAILTFLIVKMVSFFKDFAENNRYICYRINYADSYEEYRRWRGELRCQYLMLLPFVNGKNVMKVYRLIFRKRKHEEQEEQKTHVMMLFMPSILGICICLICICGMTWAWYTANIQTPTQKMTAAYYEVTVESVMNGPTKVESTSDGYKLTAQTVYTVKLTATGNTKECGGYCLIEKEDKTVVGYTQSFKPNESITISLQPETDGVYIFTGVWGSHPVGITEDRIIKDIAAENVAGISANAPNEGVVTGEATPGTGGSGETSAEQTALGDTYTVQQGDTLSAIAVKYHTTVQKIEVYNGIEDSRGIQEGQILKIPPQDYVIPETTAPGEPTSVEAEITETETKSETEQEEKTEKHDLQTMISPLYF